MSQDDNASAKPTSGGGQRSYGRREDAEAYFAELIAHYEAQRKDEEKRKSANFEKSLLDVGSGSSALAGLGV